MAQITIYTDGSALGNPGPGGYGAVLLSGPFRKELSQGFRLTTNNRMELTAVCAALETLRFEGSDVTVYSDSKYVVDAVSKGWVFGWERKGFAGKKNPDLWMRFLRVYRRHRIRFVWVCRDRGEQPLRSARRGRGQRPRASDRRHRLPSRVTACPAASCAGSSRTENGRPERAAVVLPGRSSYRMKSSSRYLGRGQIWSSTISSSLSTW